MKNVLRNILIIAVILSLLVSGIILLINSPTETLTTPTTEVDITNPLITGADWNNMNPSQREAWVDLALDAMMMGGELKESERQPAIYYVLQLDGVFYNPVNETKLVAWELTAFTSSIPAPTLTPTATLTPTPTPTPLVKEDFLITVISTRQVTLTNNSQRTVQVYKTSITYEYYSYVQYNMPGKPSPYYGPIIQGINTSDESVELKPGQSVSKSISNINPNDLVAILSCSFYVRDSAGQTLKITYN